jgi:hypothetical protein
MPSRPEDTAYGRRHAGVEAAESLAGRQHGVVSRRELAVAGLDGYDDAVHVAVPHGSSPARPPGVVVHETRQWSEADVSMRGGLRTARVPVAAVQAAAWARSDRQAALLIVMPVQQRLTTGGALLEAAGRFKRLRRRELICCVAADAADGAHSLGELDFGRECRRRGLPVPDRQVIRSGRRGRVYLDVLFTVFGDAIRQNEAGAVGWNVVA